MVTRKSTLTFSQIERPVQASSDRNNFPSRFTRRPSTACAAAMLGLLAPSAVWAGPSYSRSSWSTPADNGARSDPTTGNPTVIKRYRCDVGTTATATLTNDGNPITNPPPPGGGPPTTPTLSATVAAGDVGVEFWIPGLVNEAAVTDVTGSFNGGPSVTIQLAAFNPGGPGIQMPPLGGWLVEHGYTNDTFLNLPSFAADNGSVLSHGFDLNAWVQAGVPVSEENIGQSHFFVDGLSATMPGMLLGTSWLDVTPGGWELASGDAGYTGMATLGSLWEYAAVIPEPSALTLLALGAVAFGARGGRSGK